MLRGNKVLLRKDFEIFKRRLLLLQHHYSDCFISKPVLGHCSMQELQIKVQVLPVCGASSGTANMYREGRFSFQPFSRAMNVYKLLFDPSGFGISYAIILPCPPLFFSGSWGGDCRVGTGDAVLSISFFLPSWHFSLLWCNSPPAVLCNTITMIVLGQK